MKTLPQKHINTDFNIPHYVLKAIEILNFNGFDAFAVGGCVRDLLRGFAPHDWDLCTNALPNEIESAFAEYKVFKTGIKHGTVTVLIEKAPIEITTYRIDGEYTDNRHPDRVVFVADLKADLNRRDFTINGMAYSPKTGLIDCFGGIDDIKSKTIRAVGDATVRFNEDALRILRAMRFSSVCGYDIEKETSKAIKSNYRLLANVSVERIFSELCKLISGDNCVKVLSDYTDVVTFIIPELRPCVGYDQNTPHHCYDLWNHILQTLVHTPKDASIRLALLFHDIAKPMCRSTDKLGISHYGNHSDMGAVMTKQILKRLRCDNKTTSQICTLISLHDTKINPTNPEVKTVLNKIGLPLFRKLLIIKRADNLAKSPDNNGERLEEVRQLEEVLHQIIQNDECFTLDKLALTGHDLTELGYKGKKIGTILNETLNAVINGTLPNSRQALLSHISQQQKGK